MGFVMHVVPVEHVPVGGRPSAGRLRFTRARPRAGHGDGFTLVELLVVIAIIAVLIGLLLPAVQSAREAARRSACTNNLKQVGLALLQHHEARQRFPQGVQWPAGGYWNNPRMNWVPYLFPYLESNDLYDTFNFSTGGIPWYTAANAGVTATMSSPPTSRVVEAFLCPADVGVRTLDMVVGATTFRYATSNYLAIFPGNQLSDSFPDSATTRTCLARNYGARHADITDGASKSMILAEYVRSLGASNDMRGNFWSDQPCYSQIFTAATPNATTPDRPFPGYCVNLPEKNRPCTNGDGGPNNTAAARSMHPGGVNAVFADGSVRFFANAVDLTTWRRLATISAGDLPGDF